MFERKDFERVNLESQVERVRLLLSGETEPTSHSLGTLLALEMTLEIQQGKEIGSTTSSVIKEWTESFGEKTVEEAIAHARLFLVNPNDLKKSLEERIFDEDED